MEGNKELTVVRESAGDMSVFSSAEKFELAQRVGKVFAESSMVPAHFKGNVANCMIALNMAARMNLDPFMVFQNVYVIKGRLGIEAKLAIALINSSGKFDPLQYEFNEKHTACYAYAKHVQTGEVYKGSEVSLEMARREGWSTKPGSKWISLPDLMMQYRSAVFFARVYCPESLLGLYTKDELIDIESNRGVKNVVPVEPVQEEPDVPEAVVEGPVSDASPVETWDEFIARKQLSKIELLEFEKYIVDSAKSLGMEAEALKANAVRASDLDDMLEVVTKGARSELPKPNWWDAEKHWSFRKQDALKELILFGFGDGPGGSKVCTDNPGADNTLREALPETKRALVKKYDKMFGAGEFNKLIGKE